jgi:hypothetical protein
VWKRKRNQKILKNDKNKKIYIRQRHYFFPSNQIEKATTMLGAFLDLEGWGLADCPESFLGYFYEFLGDRKIFREKCAQANHPTNPLIIFISFVLLA